MDIYVFKINLTAVLFYGTLGIHEFLTDVDRNNHELIQV